ncbi:GNAT family N-acetyltransferase [Sphingomonas oligophenolica]|uniref:GNAT family N-acetyltransferase n=1 Tax=Sphingomonas oligophenolica TaxID=301154 RepID=UPI001F50359D|nr:GNAT family N-acetyltransferase [Sphingomonas oligophenolica]
MTPIALTFQIGARTLASVDRSLIRVPYTLDAVLAAAPPVLPPLDGDGYLITSLPEPLLPTIQRDGMIGYVRQRYVRYHADFSVGHEAWLAALSGSARATIKRKTKKVAAASGGTLDIRAYRTPDEFAAFHPLARRVSARTYQEKLLGAGLPAAGDSLHRLIELAAADCVRAWLLSIAGEPVAYLCCTARGGTLLYTYVGHDPGYNDLSPGTVLQAEAMTQLFDDRFARFDFTEGEGQHKRLFATGGTRCVDLLLLRPTLANRATVAALAGFDAAVAVAKRAAASPLLARIARRVRR